MESEKGVSFKCRENNCLQLYANVFKDEDQIIQQLQAENERLTARLDMKCESNSNLAKICGQLQEALWAIWPFLEEDFPSGTGDNRGTCCTDEFAIAVRLVEQALKEKK